MQTPPMTHGGMEFTNAINGERKDIKIAPAAALIMVAIEALRVIATQPTDSPYVVFGQPPNSAPTIEPIPSPRSVLSSPDNGRYIFVIRDMFREHNKCNRYICHRNGCNIGGI